MTDPPARRQRRKTFTDKMVASLPRKRKRYILSDPEQRGMYVRVPTEGPCVFVCVCRDIYGKQVWATIGSADVLKIEEAREQAREAIRRIKEGKPAFEPPPVRPDTFEAVAAGWMQRHVIKNKLRTAAEIERALAKYVLPFWRDRPFAELGRRDVAALLDHIEDNHGRRMADVVRTHLSSIGTWFGERSDDYVSPFLRHRPRVTLGTGKRARILSDDELRRIWRVCEQNGAFGRFVMLLLLTGQRRGALVRMKWTSIDANGVWHMAREEREKGNAGSLRLPPLALEILRQQPRMAGNDYVFFARIRADGPTTSFVDGKQTLDKNSGVTGWTLHDCRRSARSLMSRAGVPSEHAEAVLGHVIPGVAGVYARYDFSSEKGVALERLAQLVSEIVHGPAGDNVVPFASAAQP